MFQTSWVKIDYLATLPHSNVRCKGKFFWKIFIVLALSPSLCLAHRHTHTAPTPPQLTRDAFDSLGQHQKTVLLIDSVSVRRGKRTCRLVSRHPLSSVVRCATAWYWLESRYSATITLFFSPRVVVVAEVATTPATKRKEVVVISCVCAFFFRVRFSYKVFLFFFFVTIRCSIFIGCCFWKCEWFDLFSSLVFIWSSENCAISRHSNPRREDQIVANYPIEIEFGTVVGCCRPLSPKREEVWRKVKKSSANATLIVWQVHVIKWIKLIFD